MDYLAFAGLGLAFAGMLALVLRSRPKAALVLWTITLCLVPYWVGVSVGPYLPAITALGLLLLVALPAAGWAKIHAIDVILGLFLILVLIAFVLSYVSVPDVFMVVSEWTAGYLLARLIGGLLDLHTVYAIFGGIVSIAGALAMIEFALTWNPFVKLAVPGPTYAIWGTLQMRGGLLRAEGAFGHSIALGATCSLALPLVLGSNLRRWVKILCTFCLVGGSAVTLSRIGIVNTLIGLVLSIFFLKVGLTNRIKVWLGAAIAVVAVVAGPVILRVFSDAGQEASGSADYRFDLASLIPSMRVIGTSGLASRSAEGVTSWGPFKSIDSAFILAGLLYGLLPVALLLAAYVGALIVIGRGRANPPVIAVAAQLPALIGVALITQYATAFWFIAGLAVVATAAEFGSPKRAAAREVNLPGPILEPVPPSSRRLTTVEEL